MTRGYPINLKWALRFRSAYFFFMKVNQFCSSVTLDVTQWSRSESKPTWHISLESFARSAGIHWFYFFSSCFHLFQFVRNSEKFRKSIYTWYHWISMSVAHWKRKCRNFWNEMIPCRVLTRDEFIDITRNEYLMIFFSFI